MESLKILQGQFEEGAKQYPDAYAILAPWPLADLDAFEKLNRIYSKNLLWKMALYFQPDMPFGIPEQVMIWFAQAVDRLWNAGHCRRKFFSLAGQAGNIMIESGIENLLGDFEKYLFARDSYGKKFMLRSRRPIECWLLALFQYGYPRKEGCLLPRLRDCFNAWRDWDLYLGEQTLHGFTESAQRELYEKWCEIFGQLPENKIVDFNPQIIDDIWATSALVCGRIFENFQSDVQKKQPQKEQPWDESNSDYMTASDVAVKLAESKISLSKISRICRTDGEIRYMRNGRRLKVHVGDFCAYIQRNYPELTIKPEVIDEILSEILANREARKAQIKNTRR